MNEVHDTYIVQPHNKKTKILQSFFGKTATGSKKFDPNSQTDTMRACLFFQQIEQNHIIPLTKCRGPNFLRSWLIWHIGDTMT